MKAMGEPSVRRSIRNRMYSQIALGTLTGLIHSICLALTGVLLSPVLFSRLGSAGYGKWVLLISLTSYLNLYEFGLGTALAKLWGEYKSTLDLPRLKSSVTTATALFAVIGVLAVATTCVATRIWPHTLALLPYFAVGAVLMLCGEPMAGVLRGLERPHWVNLTGTASTFLNAGLTVWLLLMGWGLEAVAASLVASSGLRLLVLAVLLRQAVPGGWLLRRPNWGIFRELLKLGAADQITRVWVVAISPTNRVVLYGILGSSLLAAYDLGARVVSATALIPAVMLPTLLSAFSRLARDEDTVAIDSLLHRATRYVALVGLPICWFLLCFADPIAEAWLGRPSPDVALATRILLMGAFLNLLTGPSTQMLLGLGRPSLCIQKVLLGCCLGVLLPTGLALTLGLSGFLVGESLAAALPAVVFLLKFGRLTGFDAFQVIGRDIGRITLMLVPPVALTIFVYQGTMSHPGWLSLWTWFWLFSAFLAGVLATYWCAGLLTREEMSKVFGALGLSRFLPMSIRRVGQ